MQVTAICERNRFVLDHWKYPEEKVLILYSECTHE